MEKSKVLFTIAATVILSTNFTFADQGSLESNEYNKGEVKIITQEDIKQNAKDYSNYNLIISPFNQEYDYIDDWGSDFRYLGSGKLHASGYTETGKDVDNIRTTVYLQQYDDSNKTWVNVDSISNNQNNSSYSSTSQTYKVPEGFKYRLLIIHKATEGRVTESTSSYSSVINVY